MKEPKRSTLYSRVPQDLLDWTNAQAEKMEISQADWIRVLLTSLRDNYSSHEMNKIFLGIKRTLSQRDVIRDKESSSKYTVKKVKNILT